MLLIAAFSASSLLSCHAPIPKEATAPIYFPLQKGAKWVYKSPTGKVTRIVTEVKKEQGKYTVRVANEDAGKRSPSETVIVTDKGLFRAAYGDEALDPPICILKTPIKAGEKWSESTPFLRLFVLKAHFKVLEPEAVEVPAGRFQAVPIIVEFTLEQREGMGAPALPPEAPLAMIEWYAPNVGVVKTTFKNKAGDSVKELESFTPGQPDKE